MLTVTDLVIAYALFILVPKEGLLPCEWCGKGIPPEYLQTHQVSTHVGQGVSNRVKCPPRSQDFTEISRSLISNLFNSHDFMDKSTKINGLRFQISHFSDGFQDFTLLLTL